MAAASWTAAAYLAAFQLRDEGGVRRGERGPRRRAGRVVRRGMESGPRGGMREVDSLGFFGSFRRRPPEEVVFAGDRMEAEFVVNLLREEGFHPLLWADLPAPAYAGPLGMARVVVPPGEAEGARAFLASLGDVEIDAEGEEPG